MPEACGRIERRSDVERARETARRCPDRWLATASRESREILPSRTKMQERGACSARLAFFAEGEMRRRARGTTPPGGVVRAWRSGASSDGCERALGRFSHPAHKKITRARRVIKESEFPICTGVPRLSTLIRIANDERCKTGDKKWICRG